MTTKSPLIHLSKKHIEDLGTLAKHRQKIPKILQHFEKINSIVSLRKKSNQISVDIDLKKTEIESIIRVLSSIFSIQENYDIANEELLKTLTENIKEQANKEWLDQNLKDWNETAKLLHDTISNNPLKNYYKTLQLSYEHENLLEESKIITDLRPMFNSDGTEIVTFVLYYKLILNFLSNGERKELHLSLDSKDVSKLINQLKDEQKKSKNLQDMLEKSSFNTIVLGEENEV